MLFVQEVDVESKKEKTLPRRLKVQIVLMI